VPRSVTTTSSPCLACLRYSVRRSFVANTNGAHNNIS
jgi:hypothetical protein